VVGAAGWHAARRVAAVAGVATGGAERRAHPGSDPSMQQVTKESWSALTNKNYKWNGSRKIWHLLHAYKKVILPRFYII
jgi:hypothetical protein